MAPPHHVLNFDKYLLYYMYTQSQLLNHYLPLLVDKDIYAALQFA